MKDEVYYKDFMGKKVMASLTRELYDIPQGLPKVWPHEWEEAQIEPQYLELTRDLRLGDTNYWDYVGIALRYHEEYGVWLNRAEIKLLIKNSTGQAVKIYRNLDTVEKHIQHAKTLPAKDAINYIATHLKWLC